MPFATIVERLCSSAYNKELASPSDDVEFNPSSMPQPRQKPDFATGLCAQLETAARSAGVENRARPGYQLDFVRNELRHK